MGRQWALRGYVVERLLGAGATGEVWRARITASGEPVALKRLRGPDARHPRRIEAEAAMLTALEHPHLIRLHGVERDGDGHVLVLDLADGGSLAELLAARERLTPGEVVTALAPVAAAVAYAHAEGVVHGDVSAANVLFTAAGVALLADLGVARLLGDEREAESTAAYVDPAVAAGCVPGPAGDVFMLGGVALHALTGQPTWPGATTAEMLAAARSGELPDVARLLDDAGVPEPMAAVVARALCPEPMRRGSAAEFALDLRECAEPVAVELRAGRPRREQLARAAREAADAGRAAGRRGGPGRHAAVERDSALSTADVVAAQVRLPWRPVATGDVPGAPPPTAAVRPRPRPQLPRRGPLGALPAWRVRHDPAGPRRIAPGARRLLPAVAVVSVAAAVAVVLHGRGSADPGSPAVRRVADAVTVPSTVPSRVRTAVAMPRTTPTPRSTSTRQDSVATSRAAPALRPSRAQPWRTALRDLDRERERAFATGRAALLARVYGSRRLRRADARTLRRLVPAGCGLFGVRTRFTGVRVHPHGPVADIATVARVSRSRLVCGGTVRRSAPPSRGTRLRIVVRRTRDGPRILAEEPE